MNILLAFIVTLASILVKFGDAIDCYQCQNSPVTAPQVGCSDPFNSEGIATATCNGRCFANYTSSTSAVFSFEQVQRGCITDVTECTPSVCQEYQDPEIGSGKFCSYCCDEDLCNSMGFEPASADTLICWFCEANLTEGVDINSSSCGGDNFNGEGALALPCPKATGKCASFQIPATGPGMPGQFLRSCGEEATCALYASLPGFEADCCDGNLCNVGSNIKNQLSTAVPDKTMTTTIETTLIACWRCDSEVTNESACFEGNFPADNVLQEDCPSGTCISYTSATNQSQQVFSRGCLTPEMNSLGYCDGSNEVIKDAECCTEHLCNAPAANGGTAVIALNVATMLSAVLVSVSYLHALA